jgi:hypothetical protein
MEADSALATLYNKLRRERKRLCFLLLDCIHPQGFCVGGKQGGCLDSRGVRAMSGKCGQAK